MRTPASRAPGGGGAVPDIPWRSPPATVLPGCTPSSPALTYSGPGMASPQPLCPRRTGEVAQPAGKTPVGGRVAPDVTGVTDERRPPLCRPPRPCPALRGRLPGAQNRDAPEVPCFRLWWTSTHTHTLGSSRVAIKLGRLARKSRASRGDCGDPGAGGAGDAGARAREAGEGMGIAKGWEGAVPRSAPPAGTKVVPIHCLIDSRASGATDRLR